MKGILIAAGLAVAITPAIVYVYNDIQQAYEDRAVAKTVNDKLIAQNSALLRARERSLRLAREHDQSIIEVRALSDERTNYINSKRGKFHEKLRTRPKVAARAAGIALLKRMLRIEATFTAADDRSQSSSGHPNLAEAGAASGRAHRIRSRRVQRDHLHRNVSG